MHLKYKSNRMKRIPAELVLWIVALLLLALDEPRYHEHSNHFSLCPLANLGISWCPGCGLGRSVTQLFHGNLEESFEQHWLGLPTLLILGYRVQSLIKYQINNKENSYV